MISLSLIKLFLPILVTFTVGMMVTPILTHWMYAKKLWKKSARKNGADPILDEKGNMHPDAISKEFQKITNEKEETKTPRVGGIVVWLSVILTSIVMFLLFVFFPSPVTSKLEFISKNQTLLPFIALVMGGIIGLVDDFLCIKAVQGLFVNGLPRRYMIALIVFLGTIFGVWFFTKLGMTSIAIPFSEWRIEFGWLIVPLFIFVTMGTFSSGVIDGIDGLAGGVMASIFSAYSLIAYFNNQIDLAVFCAVVTAALLVFLWFNVPPARFYLGETGMLGLTLSLSVVAFLTDSVLLLPIIGFPLVVTSLSSFIQIVSKKIRGPEGKIFRVAPIHHHFEAIGWSRPKITMRYWIISIFFAVAGVIISLL
jgi:phospho-N-acetylmuramoyl-pentapeptide-transferase